VRSEFGVGSTFTVTLPLRAHEAANGPALAVEGAA
jgi:signal transduction histidine kinase